jgi:hypothetical protein
LRADGHDSPAPYGTPGPSTGASPATPPTIQASRLRRSCRTDAMSRAILLTRQR